jgi:hypothetical protein
MKAFMRNPRTGLPTLAVFVALVLSFAVPPFNSVVAAGSSSSSMSSSSSPPGFNCDSQFSVRNNVTPGDTVRGTLSLDNGCQYLQGSDVTVTLNGTSLKKQPDSNGAVSVTVKTNTDGKTGTMDDPVDVTLKTGRNDVIVSGQAFDPNSGTTNTATIDAFFTLDAPPPAPVTPVTVTPVVNQTTGGTSGTLAHTGMNLLALFLLALMAIALGTYTVAAERAVPIAEAGGMTSTVTVPLLERSFGVAEQWTLELAVLTAVSFILGPPPGRHVKKGGPRGLVPMARDWMYRDR